MSTQTQLTRITEARNTIRNKLVSMGLAESTAKVDALATVIENIPDNGAVTTEVKEGETYTIPRGYHNGSGTVSGVAGGGNYTLQSKTVTPTKQQQNITADAGKYGLSDVTVAAIPEAYQDVTAVTAGAGDVLATKVIVDSTGKVTTGTMVNNGAVAKTLDTATTSYTVPAGYHNGSGKIQIVTETKTATPTEAVQTISATSGKVLSSVTVNAIPDNYIATDDATVSAGDILDGKIAYGTDGDGNAIEIEGTMTNNGAVTKTLDTTTTSYTIAKGYHDGTGSVSIATETKSATPTKSAQTISATAGKVLSSVTVAAIPDAYQNVTSVDATAADVLAGKTIVSSTGAEVEGTMANNGDVSAEMDGLATTSITIPAGYTTGGTISLTNDIEIALAAI